MDISGAASLSYLACFNNILSSQDVSKNTKLFSLHCRDNILSSLDVSNNTKLEDLSCFSQIRNVNVSDNEIILTALDPEINVANISRIIGAVLLGNTFSNIIENTVTYGYSTGFRGNGTGKLMDVTLVIKNDSFTGVKKVDGQLKRFKSGVVDTAYTGLDKFSEDGKWYYFAKGVHDSSYTGFAKSTDGKWYYAKNGVWDKTFTGMVKDAAGKEYNVTNGRVV